MWFIGLILFQNSNSNKLKHVQFMYHTFHTVLFGGLTAAIAEAQF